MKEIHFCDNTQLYETYSAEEYDRTNYDIPSYKIQSNIYNGREWIRKFLKLQEELEFFRKTEMKTAYENCLTNLENTRVQNV